MSNKTNSMWEFFLVDKVETKSEIEMEFNQNTSKNNTRSQQECKKVCPHFEAFVDFYSFFLLIPFRAKLDHETSQYKIISFRCRKIIVSMIHCIYIILGFISILKTYDTFVNKRRDIGTAFYTVSHIGTFAGLLQMLKIFHWNKDQIRQLMNQFSVQMDMKAIRKARFTAFFFCLLNGCSNMMHHVFTAAGEAELIHLYNIFNYIFTPVVETIGFNPLNCLRLILSDVTLRLIAKVILGCQFVAFNIALPSLLVISLSIVTLAKRGFIQSIEQNYGNISVVLAEYTSLRKTTEMLTKIFGGFILSYYICVLCFFAELPQIILVHDAPDGFVRIFIAIYMVNIFIAMYLAANFHTKVDKCLRTFISHRNWQDDWNLDCKQRLQLVALTQEIDAEPIAVSCNFFAITLNFLGSSMGLVITYSLIVFQMSNNMSRVFWHPEE